MTTSSVDEPEGRDAASVASVVAGVLGLALTIGAFAVFGSRTALSVAAGATIGVANLVTMSAIVRRVLRPADADEPNETTAEPDQAQEDADEEDPIDHAAAGKRGGAAWGAFGLLKIVVLFGGIYLLLTRRMVDPMALVVGYGVLPLGIAASSLFTSLGPQPKKPRRRPAAKNRQN